MNSKTINCFIRENRSGAGPKHLFPLLFLFTLCFANTLVNARTLTAQPSTVAPEEPDVEEPTALAPFPQPANRQPVTVRLLRYFLIPNSLDDRPDLLQLHIGYVRVLIEQGHLLLAGPIGPNREGLFAIIRNLTPDEIVQFILSDPLFLNNQIENWVIEPYTPLGGVLIDGV